MQTTKADRLTPSIGVIGCGSLGTAILLGLLSAKNPKLVPSKICASVTSNASSEVLKNTLHRYSNNVEIIVHIGDNVAVAKACDVIVLACPPDRINSIIDASLSRELEDKLLISVLAGTSLEKIARAITRHRNMESKYWIARTLPNLAVAQQSSATAIEILDPDFPADKAELVFAIFQQLGGVVQLPGSLMDASTVLCGSTPAWIALFADGLVDGAVAGGVPRSKANQMIAQVLRSTAALLQDGQSPSALRESICAMPGCTIQGNIELERHGVRGAAACAMKTAIEAARKLGD